MVRMWLVPQGSMCCKLGPHCSDVEVGTLLEVWLVGGPKVIGCQLLKGIKVFLMGPS
jgi:hypothetical protein